jgi:hypothetical protein
MIWYLIKYNFQGMWTEVSAETSYSSADARKEHLEKKLKDNSSIKFLIVSSPKGKQLLPEIVEFKLSELREQKEVA